MRTPPEDRVLLNWLQTQLQIIAEWRDELGRRSRASRVSASKLDAHHAWLQQEIDRLGANLSGNRRP